MTKRLGAQLREIDIKEAVNQHFKDIEHDPGLHNITYENSQARERTQVLMDIANQVNGMVIGTGDMSELALGWATYNGDHMSMYEMCIRDRYSTGQQPALMKQYQFHLQHSRDFCLIAAEWNEIQLLYFQAEEKFQK